MMTLAERIHARMIKSADVRRRLNAVPPAVVEDVLRIGIATLAEMVPMETHAHQLAEIDFEACEGCGHLVDPQEPEGAAYGSEDGIWLCNACAVEEKERMATPKVTRWCEKPVGNANVCQLQEGHDGKCVGVGTAG